MSLRQCASALGALLLLSVSGVATAQVAPVQKEAFRSAQGEHKASEREVDVMEHLANSHVIEIPWFNERYTKEIELPRFAPIHLGPVELDLSPTKHSVFVVLAALLVALLFVTSARSIARI